MIKEYVINHIRNNKTTSVSIAITSFLASLLLSLLTGIFSVSYTHLEQLKRNSKKHLLQY